MFVVIEEFKTGGEFLDQFVLSVITWRNLQLNFEHSYVFLTGEAKNLQCRSHGSTNQPDVYCTLSLDQEEIFRTSTMEKTLKYVFQGILCQCNSHMECNVFIVIHA